MVSKRGVTLKFTTPFAVTALVLAANCTGLAWAADSRLVGVWEFSRFDNLHPADAPDPDGMANALYIFYNDHELIYFYPGGEIKLPDSRNNLPFKGRIPYELNGTKFRGFLGLTNDLSGTAEVTFPSDHEFEVKYPDGAIGVFTRISEDPASFDTPRLHCVPLTVRGFNYDQIEVETIRRELRSAVKNTVLESSIVGRWQSYSDDPTRVVVTIDFESSKQFTNVIVDPKTPNREPYILKGSFSVVGSYLVSDRQCFSPEKIWLENGELRLAPLPELVMTFKRVEPSSEKHAK